MLSLLTVRGHQTYGRRAHEHAVEASVEQSTGWYEGKVD